MGETKKISFVHYLIVAAFCLLFRFIPGFAGITPLGMGILGSFIGAIYGWVAIGLFWPSLIALLGIGLSVGMTQMLVAGFGNLVFFGLAFVMPIIGLCTETGAFRWIIDKVLNSKALQGKGFMTIWVLFLLAYFLGFTNPIIMCLVLCSFVAAICKQVGYEKNDKFPIYVYFGIAFASMLGQVLLPFCGTGLTLVLAYNTMFPSSPLDMMLYLAFMLPMGVFLITVYTLLLKFIFRVDVSKLADFKAEGGVPPMNRDQKIALSAFAIFIVTLMISSLPLGAVSSFLSMFGMVGIILLILGILPLIKKGDGTPLINLDKAMTAVPWGLITMMAYIMVIATYLTSADAGITSAMSLLLAPLLQLPPIVFIIVALGFACIMTNFANNMVVIVLVMPFMYTFAASVGMSATGIICLLFVMAQFALITPAASPVTAVAMSQEMADSNVMMKAAIKIVPIMFVIGLAFGWVYTQILF